jgi:nicotinate-nucleotide adenylyltransferase
MNARRVGLLGGTFDPIHRGHIDAAQAACAALDLTSLIVIPANIPPHRPQPVASTYHRFAMAALAVAGRPGWRVCDVELRTDSPSYTSATLRRFHADGYEARELFFVIGADAFAEIGSWKHYPEILGFAHFAVVSRPGFRASDLAARLPLLAPRMVRPAHASTAATEPSIILIDADTADVSSTAIRQACADGRPLTGMVGASVQQHIEQHGLYASGIRERACDEGRSRSSAGRLHGQD